MADRISTEKKRVTIFGEDTELNGVLELSEKLILTGKFTGTIHGEGSEIEISKTSVCDADTITSKSIEISGKVKGNITATERVEIFSGSSVYGDITTSRLRIANNVDYRGSVSMLHDQPEVDLFSVVSADFRQSLLVHSDVVK